MSTPASDGAHVCTDRCRCPADGTRLLYDGDAHRCPDHSCPWSAGFVAGTCQAVGYSLLQLRSLPCTLDHPHPGARHCHRPTGFVFGDLPGDDPTRFLPCDPTYDPADTDDRPTRAEATADAVELGDMADPRWGGRR